MKGRYHLLDMLRGICIIYVVVYHILYNLSEIFGGNYGFFYADWMNTTRNCFVGVLMVLSGISGSLTRSNLRRGLRTLGAALLITVVTAVAMPSQKITFGILHFFACCMLLYAAVRPLMKKLPVVPGAAVSVLLYFLTRNLYDTVTDVPRSFFLFALGFRTGHTSADYYPILPWVFLFLAGGFLGRLFAQGRVPEVFTKDPVPLLSWLGRHTMVIYLLHQPLIYGAMALWFGLAG